MTVLSRIPLHPLLFAAYAVLFLYAANLGEVLPVDAGPPLARAVLGATAALAALGLMYRSASRGALPASALVIAFFAFGHVSPVLVDRGMGDAPQLAAWALLVVVAGIYAALARASLPRVTAGLNVAAIVLVGLVAVTIVPYELGRAGRSAVGDVRAVTTATSVDRRPDIFYLVFDRYGSKEAIERRFGITDNDLYSWLEDRGFQVPADSRGAYRATDFSLASTLNLRYLDELTETIGRVSGDRTPAKEMIRNHEVARFLKSLGYTYYHMGSWFDPTYWNPQADANLTFGLASEFESVLRDTTILPAIDRLTGGAPTSEAVSPGQAFLDRHREGTLFEFRQLQRLASAPGPKFVFAHVILPHDPYVFRADGSLITEAEVKRTDERTLFAGHLAFANSQIKALVTRLLSGPEATRPIVIIQGDEGPLACQAVDCVGDDADYFSIRFGVLNAMYLPGIDARLPERFTSVNTFRFLFREYFGADLDPLPDRSFTWPDNDHIYDFREVTDLFHDPDG
jgi:hypothetical protein